MTMQTVWQEKPVNTRHGRCSVSSDEASGRSDAQEVTHRAQCPERRLGQPPDQAMVSLILPRRPCRQEG